MKQRRSNISAALAIAVERQVDEIIAVARAKCALQSQLSVQRATARAFSEQEIARELQRRVETARFCAGLRLGEIIGSLNREGPRDEVAGGAVAPHREPVGIRRFILSLFVRRRSAA
jgi:hypothetical protein